MKFLGYEIPPGVSRVTIGSAPDNDIVFDRLSRYQAVLLCKECEYILRPLGLNVYVNGEQLHQEVTLKSSDIITFGDVVATFQVEPD